MSTSLLNLGVRTRAHLAPLRHSQRLRHRGAHTQPAPRADRSPADTSIPIAATVPPLPLWQRLGPLTKALQAYGRAQRRRPWTTQLASTLVVYLCGDITAQSLRGEGYEAGRTARALVIGAGSSIPTYTWFIYLGNSFNYASPMLSLVTKVVVNQLLYTPIFNSYFFGMQALLSGHHSPFTWDGLAGIAEHVRRTVPTSFVNSCKLWPAVTAFSFTFVPADFRSVFAGVIAIGWQTYLSFLNRKAEGEEEQEKEREEHEHEHEQELPEKVDQRSQIQTSKGTA